MYSKAIKPNIDLISYLRASHDPCFDMFYTPMQKEKYRIGRGFMRAQTLQEKRILDISAQGSQDDTTTQDDTTRQASAKAKGASSSLICLVKYLPGSNSNCLTVQHHCITEYFINKLKYLVVIELRGQMFFINVTIASDGKLVSLKISMKEISEEIGYIGVISFCALRLTEKDCIE